MGLKFRCSTQSITARRAGARGEHEVHAVSFRDCGNSFEGRAFIRQGQQVALTPSTKKGQRMFGWAIFFLLVALVA
ncbi:MAG: hypothetical protein KDJ47_16660, partial [Hyphomicrobiaceae bacterium]|nr:hypothetical protein [Hyphomicrobiaceae bacterium]